MTLTVVCGPDHLIHWREFTRHAGTGARRTHPPARVRARRAPALRRVQSCHRAHDGFRRHERQGAGSDGDGARGRFHQLRMRRARPGAWRQRLDRRRPRPLSPRGSAQLISRPGRAARAWPVRPAIWPSAVSTGGPLGREAATALCRTVELAVLTRPSSGAAAVTLCHNISLCPPTPQPQASPALFFKTLNAYQETEALRAAIELDLFTAIDEGAHDAHAIGARCQASERGVRILCDYLTMIGFLS